MRVQGCSTGVDCPWNGGGELAVDDVRSERRRRGAIGRDVVRRGSSRVRPGCILDIETGIGREWDRRVVC